MKDDSEIGLSYGSNLVELYQNALRTLIKKATEEKAVFPLKITVTNAHGETWPLLAAIADDMLSVQHMTIETVYLDYPLSLRCVDAVGDTVSSMNVLIPVDLRRTQQLKENP